MVIRAPADSDSAVRHLWVGETTTACGYTGPRAETEWAPSTCVPCLERYGAEIAAWASHLPWLATSTGMTRHAFDDKEPTRDDGRVWPVCHMRAYSPDRLYEDTHAMRCPHCLQRLQDQRAHADA